MGPLLRAGMLFYKLRHWLPVRQMTYAPADQQNQVLRRLLFRNRDTMFGREHDFAGIRNHAQFLARVPPQNYETLKPYIDTQRLTGTSSLTIEPPLFYAQTSGTTGTPKYIPITATALAIHRAEQALFSYLQYRACPSAFSGPALGIMGAAVEGRLDSGHTVGSVSGYLYKSLPSFIQSRFVVPPAVAGIEDYDLRYLVILRLALAEGGITYLGSPNPSTFLRLQYLLNERRALLMDSLKTGILELPSGLDTSISQLIKNRLKPDPARAARLQNETTLTFANVWPRIRLVTTWTGGSCGFALDALRRTLPRAAAVMELGYQASEIRGSIALHIETPGGLPPLHHHFFEFVEPQQWDSGNEDFLTLDQLIPGKHYYILVTTAAGLYRYFMNDIVEVTALFNHTPLLRFVQKGKGVTNIMGEKLYETQVIEAVKRGASQYDLSVRFFLLIADEATSGYHIYIELCSDRAPEPTALAAMIDQGLCELNIEYDAKRSSGRLPAPALSWLRHGAGDTYKEACIQAGQREGQYKPVPLLYRRELRFPIDLHVIE